MKKLILLMMIISLSSCIVLVKSDRPKAITNTNLMIDTNGNISPNIVTDSMSNKAYSIPNYCEIYLVRHDGKKMITSGCHGYFDGDKIFNNIGIIIGYFKIIDNKIEVIDLNKNICGYAIINKNQDTYIYSTKYNCMIYYLETHEIDCIKSALAQLVNY